MHLLVHALAHVDFGDFRALTARPATPGRWDLWCVLADRMAEEHPTTFEDMVLPYVLGHFRRERHADPWRLMPRRWVSALLEGEDAPQAASARVVELDGLAIRTAVHHIQRVLRAPQRLERLIITHMEREQIPILTDVLGALEEELPHLRHVTLRDNDASPAALLRELARPAWRRISSLEIEVRDAYARSFGGPQDLHEPDDLDAGVCEALARMDLGHLELLSIDNIDVHESPLGGVLLESLASGAQSLRRLSLTSAGIMRPTVERLLAAPTMKALEVLELGGNWLTMRDLSRMLDADALPSLRELDLSRTPLHQETYRWEMPRGLERLVLSDTDLTDADAHVWHEVRWASGLRELDVSSNDMGELGVQHMLGASSVAELNVLRASGCGRLPPRGPMGWLANLDGPKLVDLSHPGPDGRFMGRRAPRPLAARWTNLGALPSRRPVRRGMLLAGWPIDDGELEVLISSGRLDDAQTLDLSRTRITRDSLEHIPAHLPELELLKLGPNPNLDWEAFVELLHHYERGSTLRLMDISAIMPPDLSLGEVAQRGLDAWHRDIELYVEQVTQAFMDGTVA